MDQPEGTVKKEIAIPLTVPKATVIMSYSAGFKYKPAEYLGMDILKGILDLVYTEKVREEEGGTYGVSVNASIQKRPEEKSMLIVAFECDPERAKELKSVIYKELENIASNGPKQIDLEKTVSNLMKTREEEKEHNSYWANTVRNYYLTGIDSNDDRNYADVLNKFTVNKVKKMTRKFLDRADLLELVFLPEKK
jgi:zinc protease